MPICTLLVTLNAKYRKLSITGSAYSLMIDLVCLAGFSMSTCHVQNRIASRQELDEIIAAEGGQCAGHVTYLHRTLVTPETASLDC